MMDNTITLDFATSTRTVVAESRGYAEFFGVTAEVVLMRGESGWPVVAFTGGWAELDALLTHYYDGEDQEESVRCRYTS